MEADQGLRRRLGFTGRKPTAVGLTQV